MSDLPHGTRGAYARGCRCDDCRAFNAAYSREYRRRHPKQRKARSDKGTRKVAVPHGTRSGYSWHRCRCAECRTAANAQNQAWRVANADYSREYQARYRRANPQKIKGYSAARAAAAYDLDALAYRSLILGDPCAYCGGVAVEVDHIVPIASGGDSDWSNLTPACRNCNARKRTRSLLAFLLAAAA